MVPNIQINEQLMFERHQERQSELAQQRLVAGLRRHHPGLAHRLAGKLGALLIALGTSLQQIELNKKQVMYEQGDGH